VEFCMRKDDKEANKNILSFCGLTVANVLTVRNLKVIRGK
jgi:hypothetical protein